MTAEQWRPVPGFPEYEISNFGRIVSHQPYWKRPRELKGHVSGRYRRVGLTKDGRLVLRTVHSLVCEAFHGPRPDGTQVRHLDGDGLNNHAANLAWGTPQENMLDTVRHGTHHLASKTVCLHGHEFTSANTYVHPRTGHRSCRACHRAWAREFRIRRAFRAANIRAA